MSFIKNVTTNMSKVIKDINDNNSENQDQPIIEDINDLLSSPQTLDNNPKKKVKQENRIYTVEEICERDLIDAKEKNLPEPDFDFRNEYVKGMKIYYVQVFNGFIKSKDIFPLTIRTVYPRFIVGVLDKGYCVCMGYNERNNIFLKMSDAKYYFENLSLPESTHEDKSKRKDSDDDYE